MLALDQAWSRLPSPFRGTRTMRSTAPDTVSRYSLDVSGARVLMVVPTLGRRPEFLEKNLESIRGQSVLTDIVIVAPAGNAIAERAAERFAAHLIPDPGSLPAAINAGVAAGLRDHEFVNWLGDDDLLEPGSLAATTAALDTDPGAVVAFGHCRYVDDQGRELWISRAGSWAPRILPWGPDLIPQPGMLVRTEAWRTVGGVDESYRFAFDLDLLLRLKRLGRLKPVDQIVSAFRWHPDSLTVGDRSTNLQESERARLDALPPSARWISFLWEKPMQSATRVAAQRVSARARKLSGRS